MDRGTHNNDWGGVRQRMRADGEYAESVVAPLPVCGGGSSLAYTRFGRLKHANVPNGPHKSRFVK